MADLVPAPVFDRAAMPRAVAGVLARLRAGGLRVHALTNPVAQSITANGLLALGVTPSLTVNAEEIAAFVENADGVLINLGMLDAERRAALPLAAATARAGGIPFVVDPVFAERSPARQALARALLAAGPALAKFNAREAMTFADALPPGTLRLVTGAEDCLTLGPRRAILRNGHPLLASVTATGCLLGAILAACLATGEDRFLAGIAGVAILTIAAEIAAEGAPGPGTFAVRLIDALTALDAGTLESRLSLELVHA